MTEREQLNKIIEKQIEMASEHDAKFVSDLLNELQRARTKFPNAPTFMALTEEYGESAQALLHITEFDGHEGGDYPYRCKRVYDELVQVACVSQRLAVEGEQPYKYAGSAELTRLQTQACNES